jgi:hypothetical protein
LHPIPPLAPPYGMSATALFHVINWARAFTSSGSTFQEQIRSHQHQSQRQVLEKKNPILLQGQQNKDIFVTLLWKIWHIINIKTGKLNEDYVCGTWTISILFIFFYTNFTLWRNLI